MRGPDAAADFPSLLAAWRVDLPSRTILARLFDIADPREAQQRLRQWNNASMAGAVPWPASQRIHVALTGFTTLDYLAPHIEAALLADGFVPRVTVAGYNQLFQTLADPESQMFQPGVEVLWIWCDLLDIMPASFARDPASLVSEAGLRASQEAVDQLTASLQAARGRSNALFLVNDFAPMRRSPLGIADGAHPIGFEGVYRRANEWLAGGLATIGASYRFPLDQLVRWWGLERACDPRLRLVADCPFTPGFLSQAAAGLRPYVRALKGATRKVLVLDADKTLWGGVVGEDGWDGVRIGTDPVGMAYQRFQESVLELHRRGVILALNSKNNPADVEEVFRNRAEMVLRPEHFASIQLNWQDKVANCHAIAEEINVGLDALVFWDDNPAERHLVRESLPDVQVVEVPTDPSQWAGVLRDLTWFDSLETTAEDAERGRMYAEDRIRRKAAVTATDMAAFFESLGLTLTTTPVSDLNITRVVALLSRTNQFNLTTRRHSETVIREMAASDEWSLLTYGAEDRFGGYGMVGVTILERLNDVAQVDSVLLSCRALGKGIETAMLATMVQMARSWGVQTLRATYIGTRKNAPVKDYLSGHGFVSVAERAGEVDYELDLVNESVAFPAHILLESGAPAS